MSNTFKTLFTTIGVSTLLAVLTTTPAQAALSPYGRFSPSAGSTIANYTNTYNRFYGDFNGDGITDAMIAEYVTPSNPQTSALKWSFYRGTGNQNFVVGNPLVWAQSYGVASDRFYVADFDGDYRDDIIISSTRLNADGIDGNGDLAWNFLRSVGNGFANGGRIAASYGLAEDDYYIADFNGDNKDDVLVSTIRLNADGINGNGDLAWNYLRSNGTTFDNGGRIATSYGLAQDTYYVSDFNGDNKDDILVSTTRLNADGIAGNNDLAWNYLRSNGSTFDNGGRIATSYGVSSFYYIIGNFAGDGKEDLAVAAENLDGTLRWDIVMSNGSALLPLGRYSESFGRSGDGSTPVAGKVGGDGRADLIGTEAVIDSDNFRWIFATTVNP